MAGDFELLTRASLLSAVRHPENRPKWEEAWETLKKTYEGPIRLWALSKGLSPYDAEEITQDVLTKLVKELPTFIYDRKGKFRSWLRRVVSNAVTDLWRDRKRKPGNWGTGDPAAHDLLEQETDRSAARLDELSEEFEKRIKQMRLVDEACESVKQEVEERTWQVFEMLVVEGLKPAEAAERSVMRISAVYAAKRRVLNMIRERTTKVEERAD